VIEERRLIAQVKPAMISMTQVLALEWAKHNFQVNAISPTVILTN
jgi:NAD(P)-dependent dehydrogenase (short-subunit alcohol dehydrogenase family)